MTNSNRSSLYHRHRFPPDVIAHAVWLYFRFPLNLRMVEDLLAERGITVSHQTIRMWAEKFGRQYAADIHRRSAGRLDGKWHLDEVVISMRGKKHWLWRAVDQDGFVLDVLVQSRRDTKAATPDRTHGDQQLSLFNTHAHGYCFQPIHIYDAATGRPVCFLLRPGKRPSGAEAAMVLRHVIRRIRRNWPGVAITVRDCTRRRTLWNTRSHGPFGAAGLFLYPRPSRQQQVEDALGPLEQRCGNALAAWEQG